jgi:hypothetical protein
MTTRDGARLEYDADNRMKTRLESGGHRSHGRWTAAEKLQKAAFAE